MYRLSKTIPNDIALNLIPEVAFNPSGSLFAVSHQQSNEIVVYDAHTREVVRVFKNPEAELDTPHGVLLTDRHLIVSNTHGVSRPSTFSVHSLSKHSSGPVSVTPTPYPHMREAHSLALRGAALVVTYCQNREGPGAVVSYRYNDETGEIGNPITVHEACFVPLGQPKGVAFNKDGSEVFITYATQKRMTGLPNLARRLKAALLIWKQRNLSDFCSYLWTKLKRRLIAIRTPESEPKNGIAVFQVNERGELSEKPVRVLERELFCRLENIDIVGDTVILCDTINGNVYLHDLAQDPQLQTPLDTISESVVLPHGAKLSPDRSMLVVTNYGLKVENQIIHWMTPAQGYTNSVLVYDYHHT
ncbi:MAG: hypothetical protein R3E64_03770 [Halioglobus sp.]